MSFAIFDESFYLSNNPDVKAAVDVGAFSSGLQHFEQFGLAEGRVLVSPFYDEQLYLQKYSDVATAVKAGAFKSGLQHYIQNGEAEGRSPGAFNEQFYLQANPDVTAAVKAGAFSSGLQHYEQYGQNEERIALSSGTSRNDKITGFGKGSSITGVDVTKASERNSAFTLDSKNPGDGEVDTLTGGSGKDLFILGTTSSFPGIPPRIPQSFYDGGGSADYAKIRNFEPGSDTIQLAGYQPFFYSSQVVKGNLNISTLSGDLIAVVEGVTSLSPLSINTSSGTFQIG